MMLQSAMVLFLCFVAASSSAMYGAGLPGMSGEPVQADFSFTDNDGDAEPAPVPGGGAIIEWELFGTGMSFSFTGDDSNAGAAGKEAAARPLVSGESLIQRELSSESNSFGFTD